jgi:hypothetical protein
MKYKQKNTGDEGKHFHTQNGNSLTAIPYGEKGKDYFCKASMESFLLSEFGIDTDTMEEHKEELVHFVMHNELNTSLACDQS